MSHNTGLLPKMPVQKGIDEVIAAIPMNRFHYILLILCGLGFCVDAMEIVLLGFISSCAGVEFGLSNAEIASITSSVFIGALIGSLMWGPIADQYGRRPCYMACILTTVSGAWLSGFAPNFGWLVTLRFIVGVGVGGATVPFDIFAEFLPPNARGRSLMLINMFWSVGAIFVTLIAMVTIPKYSWQGLIFVTAVPVTICALVAAFVLPESPRWLISQGRYEEAREITMKALQHSDLKLEPFYFDKDSLGVGAEITERREDPRENRKFSVGDLCSTIWKGAMTTFRQYKNFLGDKSLTVRTLKVGGIWFIFGVTYYGVVLLVTRMYGESAGTRSGDSSATCEFDYGDIAVNTSAEFVGLFLSTLTIDSIGRRATQSGMYMLGAASLLILGVLRGESQSTVLVLGYIARMAAMGSSCSTWVVTPELYPTKVRATAHSFVNALARIGASFSPLIVASSISTLGVALILGACNALAALLALSLQETNGKDLDAAEVAPAAALQTTAFTTTGTKSAEDARVPNPMLSGYQDLDKAS